MDGEKNFREFFHLNISSNSLDDSLLNKILEASPNFNYLYSNYSLGYSEPFLEAPQDLPQNLPQDLLQSIVNLFYGPGLDVIVFLSFIFVKKKTTIFKPFFLLLAD